MTGIATFQLFDINFTDVVWSTGSTEITVALVISAASFVGTVATNDNTSLQTLKDDAEKLDDYYYGAIILTAGLMVGWVLLPNTVASFFQSSDLWGLVYVGITTTATFAIGWML
ncbi:MULTISPECIES: hypothetical protein [Haloferax]|nr:MULTISPECIES: hypothetical protein [Haloferax]